MNVCLVEGSGRDFKFSCLDTLVDSSAVFFVGCEDVLYNGEDSQFDYWLCLIGNWYVENSCKRLDFSCNMIL